LPLNSLARRRARYLVLTVTLLVLVSSTYTYWHFYVRPWTIREVLNADSVPVGGAWDLEGEITGISFLNTSYGPATGLELDGNKTCQHGSVLGEPGRTYRIGDWYRTTLHFMDFELNGQRGVWAPELLCPFPWTSAGAVSAIDALSDAYGTSLEVRGSNGDGWYSYAITDSNSTAAPQSLSVVLRAGLPFGLDPRTGEPFFPDSASEWIVLAGAEYTASQGLYGSHPELDRLSSLADAASVNGGIRFVDASDAGTFGSGDRIELRLDSTDGEGHYQTYFLVVFDPVAPAQPVAVKYILQGPDGPYEWLRP